MGHVQHDITGEYRFDVGAGWPNLPWIPVSGPVVELAKTKRSRLRPIDHRTDELIAVGHEFPPGSGLLFSLSANAQRTWLGMVVGVDSLSYPLKINLLNDSGSITLQGKPYLTVSGVDSDGAVKYEAVLAKSSEIAITIEHSTGPTGSGNESLLLRATTTSKAILIEFATDVGGVSVVPTAAQVAALVTADGSASALVTATAQGTGLSDSAPATVASLAHDVLNFYGSAMLTVRACLDSGTSLKSAVNAAVDQAALDLVVDNR